MEGEFYLEGNIVFRQGDRVIYADAMYYNVTRQYGMVLGAEAITSVPDFEGVVRLKADVLQQVSSGEFIAFDAAVTSSRMGVPRYWLQSEQLRFSDQTRAGIDPATRMPVEINDRVISSTNNFVYFGGVPLLYWPAFSSDVTVSSFYVNSVRLRRDSIFGSQVFVDWDVFQLLGTDRPPDGVQWTLSTDYLSERGPALGQTRPGRSADLCVAVLVQRLLDQVDQPRQRAGIGVVVGLGRGWEWGAGLRRRSAVRMIIIGIRRHRITSNHGRNQPRHFPGRPAHRW